MLDYKDIITKHFALGMSGAQIAESLGVSKSGVNDFLRAFKRARRSAIHFRMGSRIMALRQPSMFQTCQSAPVISPMSCRIMKPFPRRCLPGRT